MIIRTITYIIGSSILSAATYFLYINSLNKKGGLQIHISTVIVELFVSPTNSAGVSMLRNTIYVIQISSHIYKINYALKSTINKNAQPPVKGVGALFLGTMWHLQEK
ncbi:hypothetical protein ACJX0J_029937 [Zea mays]